MGYVVDGSNLGGLTGGAAGARDAAAIVRLLLPWARGRRRVVVVFDGPPATALADRYGGLTVRFAAPRSADDAILALLGDRAAGWCVVSDDRALLAASRARGARTLRGGELLARLDAAARQRPEPREGPVDVAEWEEWFRRGAG